MSRLLILFHFYRNFLVIVFLVDLIGCILIKASDSISYGMMYTIAKIAINLLVGFLYHLFRKDTLYYYNNLGFSTVMVYTSMMMVDLVIWSFCGLVLIII